MRKITTIRPGQFQKPEPTAERVFIPSELLRELRAPCGIKWEGLNMEPVIPDGAAIYVDEADSELIEGEIYVFHLPVTAFPDDLAGLEINPAAFAPRRVLSIEEDGVLVGEENPDCPPCFIGKGALKVLGRVKVIGRPTGKEGEYTWSRVESSVIYH